MAITSTTSLNASTTTIVDSLLAVNSGIIVQYDSITLNASGPDAVNFYDGSLNLGIGSGLLLTSGYAPGTVNNSSSDGQDNSAFTGFNNGDADIDAVVNTVFQTQSYDATALSFDFTVADPTATSVSFDVVFGSEEYPEWVDAFVDSAVVIVNGVNYALFNHDPNAPLSVISSNLAAGYFQDNANQQLSIQYDGVSQVLKIVAPINGGGVNHIKIGIADTGDHVLDSGIFIANLTAGNIPGSGVVYQPGTGTSGDDQLTGSSKSEYFAAYEGNDTVFAGGGDDIVVGGLGDDAIYGGSGADEVEGDGGNDVLDGGSEIDTAVYAGNQSSYQISFDAATGKTTVSSLDDGIDLLSNIEQIKFKDGLFGLSAGQLTEIVANPTPTNTPGTVAISGKVVAGQVLSAVVIDSNGVNTANVVYQWSTSVDGVNWSVAGDQSTLTLDNSSAGSQVKVSASYIDGQNFQENLVSSVVTVAQTSNKILIEPMLMSAPDGAGVMGPLTTLVDQATALGYSPSEASILIKEALGIDAGINLATYDFYAALIADETDVQAIAFGKIAGMVAMTASVSDPTGLNLTLAVLSAAAQMQTLDLTNAADLAAAGLDSAAIDFAQALNQDMADASTFAKMESVWDDWAGQRDNLKSLKKHFEVLSVDLNQAPTGFSDAQYTVATGDSLTLSNTDLIAGFTDPDGDALTAVNMEVDQGGIVTQNPDGSWTFTPAEGFAGPVELSYLVSDGQTSVKVTALLVVDGSAPPPANLAPTLTGDPAVLADAVTDADALISTADLLTGFTDPEADALSVDNVTATIEIEGQSVVLAVSLETGLNGIPAGTYVINPPAVTGLVTLHYDVIDSHGNVTAATLSYAVVAPPNVAPTGEVLISGIPAEDQMLTAAHTLADADGMGTVSYQWYADGVAIDGATADAYTLTAADVGKAISVLASYTDGAGHAESMSSAATAPVLHVNHAATGEVILAGTAAQNQTLTVTNTLADADGLGAVAYQWLADGSAISGATGDTYVLSQGDVNKAISVVASFTDGFGTEESMVSLATTPVANVNDAPTGVVSISGTAQQGQTLFAANTLKDLDGLGTITYQWLANGVAIAGAAGSSYQLTSAEVGKAVTVKASYVDGFGAAESITSAATSAVAALAGVTLSGGSKGDVLTGTAGADLLNGLGGNDTLNGFAGNDVLIGGSGNDKLDGGADADLFIIEKSAEHSTAEVADTGISGIDELRFAATSKDTLTLFAGDVGIERVVIGTGNGATAVTSSTIAINVNASAIKNGLSITGNAGANTLTGTAFADLLDGGAGVDTLIGGAGNDIYVVDLTAAGALQDTVTENGTDSGDTLVLRGASTNTSAVTLTLASTLENLDASATGTSRLNLTGNASANHLIGNASANVLNGNGGDDWLAGGEGADLLDGGAGRDVFAYGASTQSDRAVTDKISNVDFGGTEAASAVDRFHFDGITITTATLLNNVSTNAMNTLTALQSTLSFMSAGEAVLMNVTSGVGVGTYLFVEGNGIAGYQASGDYAIQLVGVTNLVNFDLSDVTA